MKKLMSRLGFIEYVVQGEDWGAMIAWTIAHLYPKSAKAIHINLLSYPSRFLDLNPTIQSLKSAHCDSTSNSILRNLPTILYSILSLALLDSPCMTLRSACLHG